MLGGNSCRTIIGVKTVQLREVKAGLGAMFGDRRSEGRGQVCSPQMQTEIWGEEKNRIESTMRV